MTRPDRRRLRHGVRRLAVRTLFLAVLLSVGACGDDPAPHDGDHVISGDLVGDREQATLLMTAGADVIRVRAHDLGGELYRISTPEDSKVLPTAVLDDKVLTTDGWTDAGDRYDIDLTAGVSQPQPRPASRENHGSSVARRSVSHETTSHGLTPDKTRAPLHSYRPLKETKWKSPDSSPPSSSA